MKEYQAVILLLYPRLKRVAADIAQVVEAQATASFWGRESAEECVERLLAYTRMRQVFLDLAARVEEALSSLTREERYLLEYKYFRRRKVLVQEYGDLSLCCSQRTYYRKQGRLALRVNALFVRAGMTQAWFDRELASIPYVASALERLHTAPSALIDKRARRELNLARKRADLPAVREPNFIRESADLPAARGRHPAYAVGAVARGGHGAC